MLPGLFSLLFEATCEHVAHEQQTRSLHNLVSFAETKNCLDCFAANERFRERNVASGVDEFINMIFLGWTKISI